MHMKGKKQKACNRFAAVAATAPAAAAVASGTLSSSLMLMCWFCLSRLLGFV